MLTGTYPPQAVPASGPERAGNCRTLHGDGGYRGSRKPADQQFIGGQLQRVFIARALAQQADIFFLDEPFVGIDLVSETIIVKLLKQLRAEEQNHPRSPS